MAVDDSILVREKRRIVTILEYAPGEVINFLEGPVQIIVIILRLGDRIRYIHSSNPDPPDNLRVDLLKLLEIDRVHKLRKRLRLPVLNRALTIRAVKDGCSGRSILQLCQILQHLAFGRLRHVRRIRLRRTGRRCVRVPGHRRCKLLVQILVLIGSLLVVPVIAEQSPARIAEDPHSDHKQQRNNECSKCAALIPVFTPSCSPSSVCHSLPLIL